MCWHPNTFPQNTSHGESPANALLPRTALPSGPRHKTRGCLTTSHTGSIHTDKQILSAESQPQHRLPSLRPHRGWREPSLPDRDTPVALRHRAVLRTTNPNSAHGLPQAEGLQAAWLPSKGGGYPANRSSWDGTEVAKSCE